MRRILIVDDEPKIHQEFKKTLRPVSQEWNIEYAASAKEALNTMSQSPYDVIVSDMHMPEMDGAELLGIVMERHPETVRIILSDHSNNETVLRSVKSAHQFLMKPCDADTMKHTIIRTCKLQDLLRNKDLKKVITGIKELPSFPAMYGLIMEEMQSHDTSLKKVGDIISQDASMSAKILQLVNSAFFGLPRQIVNPQQAAIYLGIDTLKALVLSIHVFSSFPEDLELYGVSLPEMWRHSMMVGRLAGDIARIETADKEAEDEALIAGILHDIGKLILLKAPDQSGRILDFAESSGCSLVEAEYAVLKTSHAELGAYLLGLWGLPDNIVETIAFHHNPSKLIEDIFVSLHQASGKTEAKTSVTGLKPHSLKKFLKGVSTLTAVHVANSLLNQKDLTCDSTVFPHADMLYLRTLNLAEKLPGWVECCSKVRKASA